MIADVNRAHEATGGADRESQDVPERPDRIGYCEITGHTYVKARPGVPKITSEEIKKMLEDFP